MKIVVILLIFIEFTKEARLKLKVRSRDHENNELSRIRMATKLAHSKANTNSFLLMKLGSKNHLKSHYSQEKPATPPPAPETKEKVEVKGSILANATSPQNCSSGNPNSTTGYIKKGELYLRRLFYSACPKDIYADREFPSKKFIVYLNKDMIFFSKRVIETMEEVQGGLALRGLFSEDEDIAEEGLCCARVTKIIDEPCVKSPLMLTGKYCFKLTTENEVWTLCSKKQDDVEDWISSINRQILITVTNKSIEEKWYDKITKNSKYCSEKYGWDWIYQKDWRCACKYNQFQSPIGLYSAISTPINYTNLVFAYKPIYGADVKWENNEIAIYADFGELFFYINKELKSFKAYKITFKFQAEHYIDNSKFDAEMLIYHVTELGVEAILSVLLQADKGGDINRFLNKLNPELWPSSAKDEEYRLLSRDSFSLQDTFPTLNFDSSFFWYTGSHSKPPCDVGVNRFVLKTPIKISMTLLNAMLKSSFSLEDNGNSNTRINQISGNRFVYFQKNECADSQFLINDPTNPFPLIQEKFDDQNLKYVRVNSSSAFVFKFGERLKTGKYMIYEEFHHPKTIDYPKPVDSVKIENSYEEPKEEGLTEETGDPIESALNLDRQKSENNNDSTDQDGEGIGEGV